MFDLLPSLLVPLDLLVGVGWVLLLLYNARELSSYHNFFLRGESVKSDELVSVIVPARNEEKKIGQCLQSIRRQTHGKLEIIVVDDELTDNTAQIVKQLEGEDKRIRLIRGEELPHEWVGKSWACHQGYHLSKGEWLLFVDSDSVLANDAVGRALSYSEKNGKDALSIAATGDLTGFWGKTVWPVLASLIRLLYPLRGVNDPRGRSALVFGAFILIRRRAYERIGGHKAVMKEFVEDKQIGNNLKAAGVPFGVLLGERVVTAGLPGGASEVWNSIRRIASNPVRNAKLMGIGFVTLVLLLSVYPWLILGAGWGTGSQADLLVVIALISLISPAAIVTYDVHNTTSRSYLFALIAPLAGAIVMVGILRQIIGGREYSWRGRTYKQEPHEAA